jgi:hypothetical protein
MPRRFLPFLMCAWAGCAHPGADEKAARRTAPVPIEVPRRAGQAVVVLPLQLVQAPLFPQERERLARWAARHLAVQNDVQLDVVPPEAVAEIRARAADNFLAPDRPACAARPALSEALVVAYPQAWHAQPRADCSKPQCLLVIEVLRPDGPNLRWQSPVAAPFGPDQWEAAAQKWSKVAEARAGSTPPTAEQPAAPSKARAQHQVDVVSMRPLGAWADPPPPALAEALRPLLSRCHERGRIPLETDVVALEVDPAGRLVRCDAQSWRDPPDDPQLTCYCEALRRHTFAEGSGTRRLALEVRDDPELDAFTPEGERVTAGVTRFESSDPALTADVLTSVRPWLGLCYATTRLRADVQVTAQLQVAPSGEILDADIRGAERNELLASCVEGYLRYLPLPCTRSGQAATLNFEVLLRHAGNGAARPPQAQSAPATRTLRRAAR